jgi:hypothetical protein
LIGTSVAFASPELEVGPQSILGVDLTGIRTPSSEVSLAVLAVLVAVLVCAASLPEVLLLSPPVTLAVTSDVAVAVPPDSPGVNVISTDSGTVASAASSRNMLIALSSASILLRYFDGSVSSHAGGVSAVNALSMMEAGSPVVEAYEV